MKKSLFVIFLVLAILESRAQTYEISFAGDGESMTVDSVIVENLTQGTSLSLGGDDLLNLILNVGIDEPVTGGQGKMLVYPNPVAGDCFVGFETPSPDMVDIELFEVTGKRILQVQAILEKGSHTYNLSGIPGGIFILKITSDEFSYSAKIISMNSGSGKIAAKHTGTEILRPDQKQPDENDKTDRSKSASSIFDMDYTTGDILKFRGRSGVYKAISMLVPTHDQVVTFLFIQCTDEDDHNYATVKIGNQVWMAENLNAGARINSYMEQNDNGIIEKYCLYDDEENCETYGGLYQWHEMMQYQAMEGIRGICPSGFHIPAEAEWAELFTYLGGASVAGGKLKESGLDHWIYPNEGATDESGFEALPGGYTNPDGSFTNQGNTADIWSSKQYSAADAWARSLEYNSTAAGNFHTGKGHGLSCRCILDSADALTKLAGYSSKTWKLLRDVSTGRYPLEVGPADHSTIWWAMGYNNYELANRPCMLNDEWTFGRDGSMVFETRGDYWAEGGIFEPGAICQTTDNMIAITGEDCSDWGDGTHQFQLVTGTDPKLKALGHGAYIGFYKSATEYEVMNLNPMVQDSVIYNLVKLSDGETDTLIVETFYYFNVGDLEYGGYWRYTLVHYDDPEDEPPIPGPSPVANFTVTVDGLTVYCTNTSTYGETYLWDFGDGQTATTTDAIHTYAAGGIYTIQLTATNAQGSSMASQVVFISGTPLTEELLQGAPWRIRVAENSIFVGSGLGLNNWWSVPLYCLDGSASGTPDDWSCITDDEFTFSDGGVYTYDGLGIVRNDGYFGTPNGCWDESWLTGNGLYFASGDHTYTFTPASGNDRAVILLTNGPGRAAFIGFMKGYYGGENVNSENPPNGGFPTNKYEVMGYAQTATKEYLFVSVDITAEHSGMAAWSVILER
jgi:uncharacterized protein (TIGR02145 family)